jgi:hypothetical protein
MDKDDVVPREMESAGAQEMPAVCADDVSGIAAKGDAVEGVSPAVAAGAGRGIGQCPQAQGPVPDVGELCRRLEAAPSAQGADLVVSELVDAFLCPVRADDAGRVDVKAYGRVVRTFRVGECREWCGSLISFSLGWEVKLDAAVQSLDADGKMPAVGFQSRLRDSQVSLGRQQTRDADDASQLRTWDLNQGLPPLVEGKWPSKCPARGENGKSGTGGRFGATEAKNKSGEQTRAAQRGEEAVGIVDLHLLNAVFFRPSRAKSNGEASARPRLSIGEDQ